MKSCLDTAAKSFMHPAYSLARIDGKSMLIMETSCKNNLNFLTDIPMIYVNLIVIVCTVSEKKCRRHYFHTDLCICIRTVDTTARWEFNFIFWTQPMRQKSPPVCVLVYVPQSEYG